QIAQANACRRLPDSHIESARMAHLTGQPTSRRTTSEERVKIESIEGIPVTIPGRAAILTSYGSLKSWSRTIIKITTDNGLVGWGDVSARIRPETLKTFEHMLRGVSPWSTTVISTRIRNWNYYPWQAMEPIMAGIEMACID